MNANQDMSKFLWSRYLDYFEIATEHYSIVQKLEQEHDSLSESLMGRELTESDISRLAEKTDSSGKNALIVVILAAFTLEAYINHYGIEKLSRNYFSKYLDKLDLLSKWLIIPRIITGKGLDPGSHAMQQVDWLVGYRNKLAHSKPKTIDIYSGGPERSDFLWAEDAEKAINAVRAVVRALQRIDPQVECSWVD